MDFKYIEQLLERYWQCETSLEEEAQLRTFFTEEDVPEHLSRYKDLFVYQQLQQEEHLGADFDARVLAEIEAPVVKARRMTLTARFMPLFKAAAAVAVVTKFCFSNDYLSMHMHPPSRSFPFRRFPYQIWVSSLQSLPLFS